MDKTPAHALQPALALTPEERAWLAARLGGAALTRVPSEEAAVWRVEGGEGVTWLKAHLHANKADREAAVYARLSALGDAVPFARPQLLGRPSARALLLSDLGGAPLTPSDLHAPSLLRALGAALGAWHQLPFEDHDALAPVKALARRWRGLLEVFEALGVEVGPERLWALALSPLEGGLLEGGLLEGGLLEGGLLEGGLLEGGLLEGEPLCAARLSDALREALGVLSVGLERLERHAGRAWWRPLAARHLCHRDVRPQNLRLMGRGSEGEAGKEAGERAVGGARLGLLDFGQARPDLWCADWVTLYSALRARRAEGGAAPDWRAAWGAYCAARALDPPRAEEAARLLRVASSAHALGTASWALRHADARVARRALGELLALVRALEAED